jgi:uncharacterized membrane protein
MKFFGKYVLGGVIAVIPLWVTWLVVEFVFGKLLTFGTPLVQELHRMLSGLSPGVSERVSWPVVDKVLAVALTLAIFYAVGWAANHILGRRLIGVVEGVLARVPLIKTIYGGVRKLISTFEGPPEEAQRIVLINFPSEEMKTVGILTRLMSEEGTGRTLAIVYVPTTPNPTSGYVEIVPIEQVVTTDWTLDEAMNFIVSAGAVAPTRPMKYTVKAHPSQPPSLLSDPET